MFLLFSFSTSIGIALQWEIESLRTRSREYELRVAEPVHEFPPVPLSIPSTANSLQLDGDNNFGARIRRRLGCKLQFLNPRWWTFAMMFLAGLAIMLSGMTSLQSSESKRTFIMSYLTWILATCVLVLLNAEFNGAFVLHCMQYLLCIGITLWFSSSVLRIDPDVLYIFIPICTDTGVFLGLGVDHILVALGHSNSAIEDQDRETMSAATGTFYLKRLALVGEVCMLGANLLGQPSINERPNKKLRSIFD